MTRAYGADTAYWEYGDPSGEPVLLIHGFRGDHHGLEGMARQLPSRRVIIPDLPGFGATGPLPVAHTLDAFAAWLAAFAEAISPEGHHLVGHSFGSLVVSRAVSDGLKPRSLTLINPISTPALHGPRAVLTKLAMMYYRLGAVLPSGAAHWLLAHPLIVRGMSASMAKTCDRDLRRWIHAQHAAYFSTYHDRNTLLQAFDASVSHTVRDIMSTYPGSMTLIAGERDDITPLNEQLRLSRMIPGCRLRVIPGSGHLVHYEAPELAAQIISETIDHAPHQG